MPSPDPDSNPDAQPGPDPADYEGLTRWVLQRARSRGAAFALFLAGVLDSSVLPMPLEAPMAGLMIGARRRIPIFLAATVAGALLGALGVYAAGALAMEAVAGVIGAGLEAQVRGAADRIAANAFPVIALGGLTPFPWPMVALGAGLAGVNPLVFLIAALAGRGGRFALIALGVALFGDKALAWWRDAPNWARIGFWAGITVLGLVWLGLALAG